MVITSILLAIRLVMVVAALLRKPAYGEVKVGTLTG